MKNWKEVISEVTAAQKRKAGEEVLKQLRSQAKQENKEKGKSSYQDYLERQLEFKKKKYEDQKKRQIEKIKEKDVEKHKQKAKASIAGIKKQQIGSGESEGTAYSKLIGNVGSAAAGLGGAAYHGVKYLAAKRKAAKEAEEAKKRQQEKRERKSAGRPPSPKSQSSAPTETTPKQKLLPPSQKRLPPAGATGMRSPNFPTLGQRARKNPSLKSALIKKVNERYSNWRNELLIEVENKGEKEKVKFIDVMKGKNKVEIMPNEKNVNEAIAAAIPLIARVAGGAAARGIAARGAGIAAKGALRKKAVDFAAQKGGEMTANMVQKKLSKKFTNEDEDEDLEEATYPSDFKNGSGVAKKKYDRTNQHDQDTDRHGRRKTVDEGAAWTKKSGKSESGGLNEKGRRSYERENPGSDLKAPSKKVGNKRRASFCARMSGMKAKLTSKKTANDPDSRINKSLRAWNC